MKTPVNWAGNKYRYMDNINKLVEGKKYDKVYDVFMGSGNILLNIDVDAEEFIGNDSIPLIPDLYGSISKVNTDFTVNELENLIDTWNKFSDKKYYYLFRDYWNEKYLNNNYDKEFIYETIMLLKMCSNSLVRFNTKEGYFNQGFRGLSKDKSEFFSNTMKTKIIKELNNLNQALKANNYTFISKDFKDILSNIKNNSLIILDPPYILGPGMYGNNYTLKDDLSLLSFLETTGNDFILFNYLESADNVNKPLKEYLENNGNLYVEVINDSISVGQGRVGTKNIKEIIVSNIC